MVFIHAEKSIYLLKKELNVVPRFVDLTDFFLNQEVNTYEEDFAFKKKIVTSASGTEQTVGALCI